MNGNQEAEARESNTELLGFNLLDTLEAVAGLNQDPQIISRL